MNKVKCNSISLIFIVFMSFWMQSLLAEEQAINDNTYLKVARDQLSLAFDKYKAGDISAAKKSLRKASDWLNKAVAHSEHDKLKSMQRNLLLK